jgi:hypothetical protein
MYPTRGFKRWIADRIKGGTSLGVVLGVGLGIAAMDGDGDGFLAVGEGLTACGEQAASTTTATSSVRRRGYIAHITKASRAWLSG